MGATVSSWERDAEQVLRQAYWALYDIQNGLRFEDSAGPDVMGEIELLMPSIADDRSELERERADDEGDE
jgi:hypothetical protein